MTRTIHSAYPAGSSVSPQSDVSRFILTLALGVLVPTVLYGIISSGVVIPTENHQNSIIAAILATGAGVYLLNKLVSYPGVSHAASILPIFSATFGSAIVIVLLTRTEYSSALLALTFVATTATQFALAAAFRRNEEYVHYLLPGGRVERLIPALGQNFKLWSNPDELIEDINTNIVVVADLHHDHSLDGERRLAEVVLAGIPVYHYKQVQESLTGRVEVDHMAENDFGSLLPSLSYAGIKRLVDLAGVLIAVPILIPLFAITAAAIKFDSKGPVFFRQTRIGFRGQPFRVLKFRTMIHDPQQLASLPQIDASKTGDQDPRVTRVGQFLRRSRIDELPQVYNILRGEMSWIGPRPEAQALSEWYAREIPFYAYRHIVRPGISGWAQINQGHVTEIDDVSKKLQFDFFYIRNFSYWIDMLVVFRTLSVVFSGFGSK